MKLALTLALLAPLAAQASPAGDINFIRTLLAPGTDVAQIQAAILYGQSAEEAIEAGASNYLIRDLNGDGRNDILVVVEKNPTLEDNSGDAPVPCKDPNEGYCQITFKARSLDLYLGSRDGFVKSFSNDAAALDGDEGGAFGDPLEGLFVKKSGAVAINHYGGSAWRWSYTDVMQFRKGEFYVIGQDSYYGWTGDLRSETKSVNLLTGQVVETTQKDGDAPIHTRRYKIAKKPLVRVADYTGQME